VSLDVVSRDVISDEVWAVIGPLFPTAKATGRPPVDRRTVVEATAWQFRTGAPWRDVPERFERCFNKLKQWRGIAMRSDKLAHSYHAGLCLAAILHWLTSNSSNTA
jgi:transposase